MFKGILAATAVTSIVVTGAGIWGCAGGRSVNCDMVRMHRESGMSDTEIGAGFAVSAAQVASSCGPPGATVGMSAPAPAEAAPASAGGEQTPPPSPPTDTGSPY